MSDAVNARDIMDAVDREATFMGDETPVNETGVAVRTENAPMLGGAVDLSNVRGVKPPYMSVTYGVGKFAELFSPGSIVIGSDTLILDNDPKNKAEKFLNVIVLRHGPQYVKESLSNDQYKLGVIARTFKTPAEAAAAGLRSSWGANGEKPQVSEALDLTVLVEKPEGLEDAIFNIEIGGKSYAIAQWNTDKSVCKSILGTFLSSATFSLRGKPVWTAKWKVAMKCSVAKTTSNKTWVPTFKLDGFLNDAEKADILATFGGGAA